MNRIMSSLAILFLLFPSSALAVSDQRRNIERYPFYDPSAEKVTCTPTVTNPSATTGGGGVSTDPLVGATNTEQAYRFFVTKGLSPVQSAGIVGNLIQESGVNPSSHQGGGGPGRGIAQWTVTERWVTLLQFASNNNMDPWALNTQLNFLWLELTTSYKRSTYDKLILETTIVGATQTFEVNFERAGIPNMAARIKNAQRVYDQYSGAPPGTNPGGGATGSGASEATDCAPQTTTPASAGGLATGTYAELLVKIQANKLVSYGSEVIRRDIETGKGKCIGGQVGEVAISPDLLKLIINVVEATKTPIVISSVVSNHNCLASSGNISNHSYGFALDIGNEAQANVLYPYLYNNRQLLQINELIYSTDGISNAAFGAHNLKGGQDFNYGTGTLSEHQNHIHVSVKKGI